MAKKLNITTIAEACRRLEPFAEAAGYIGPAVDGDRWVYLLPGNASTAVRVGDLRAAAKAYRDLRGALAEARSK